MKTRMKFSNRLLSFVLSLTLIIGMQPFSVSASTGTVADESTNIFINGTELVANTYYKYSDGTLSESNESDYNAYVVKTADANEDANSAYTLTINELAVTGAKPIYANGPDLTIEVVGKNTLIASDSSEDNYNSAALYVGIGTLRITGSGTLNVTGGNCTGTSSVSSGIESRSDLTIDMSGAVNAYGGQSVTNSSSSYGIQGNEAITVIDGAVTAIGGTSYSSNGVYANKDITVSGDGLISASFDDAAYGNAVYVYEGNVTVSGNGRIDGTGDVGTYYSTGVWVDNGNIVVKDTAIVNGTGGESTELSYGIYVSGSVSASGSARLNGTGGYTNWNSVGVYSGDCITVTDHAKVNGTGGSANPEGTESVGLSSAGITIKGYGSVNGYANVAFGSYGIVTNTYGSNVDITVCDNGSIIGATADRSSVSCGIDMGGLIASDNASVVGNAGYAGYGSVGINIGGTSIISTITGGSIEATSSCGNSGEAKALTAYGTIDFGDDLWYQWTTTKGGAMTPATTTGYIYEDNKSATYLKIEPMTEQYTVKVVVVPEMSGTVIGDGKYDDGALVTVTATSNTGYHFVNWSVDDEEVSVEKSYTFEVNNDITLNDFVKIS